MPVCDVGSAASRRIHNSLPLSLAPDSGERIPAEERGYHYLDTLIARIHAVAAADIQRIAEQYFTANNRTVGYLVDTEKEQAVAAV